MLHIWQETVLAPARLDRDRPKRSEVRWWPHCSICGAQACLVGKNIYYRANSSHEWTLEAPSCQSKVQE